jgi:hypothetical protein
MSGRLFSQIAVLIFFTGCIGYAVEELILSDERAYFEQMTQVDGLTWQQRQDIAKKAGNSHYYSEAEINAFIAANKR